MPPIDIEDELATVWEALGAFREDCIPEGEPRYDEQWDDICTAMARITEALGIDPIKGEENVTAT